MRAGDLEGLLTGTEGIVCTVEMIIYLKSLTKYNVGRTCCFSGVSRNHSRQCNTFQ